MPLELVKVIGGDTSNQLKWYFSMKALMSFLWGSTEREKQMVLRASCLIPHGVRDPSH